MKLELDNNFYIESDESNFVLYKKSITSDKSKTPGKETVKPLGFYGTLQSALRGYVKYSTRLIENENVNQILEKLNSIESIILKIK